MSLVCEISGEPLLGNANGSNEIVVTPSGHICNKRLLLTKLAENGGLDPFETTKDLPLSEDQLVTLGGSARSSAVPPRPQATSFPNMLGLIQKEYDALVLELFDTRKALEETRRELSQALYQNDAAIRVVARIAQERDAAKQQLEQWNASAAAVPAAEEEEPTVAAPTEEEPSAKRRRILEPTAKVLKNDLPEDDLQAMTEVWTQLSKTRKPTLKAATAEAPSTESLANCGFLEKKAWHKSTNRGIPCISSSEALTVTAGKDKQIIVYNEVDQVVQNTFFLGCIATCVDIGKAFAVAGTSKGKISLFSLETDGSKGEIDVGASAIVDVRVHPTGQHIVAATSDGRLIIAIWLAEEQRLQHIATFRDDKNEETYTAGCIHPDGLIYLAGTKTGKLHVWDLKNKVLAATFQVSTKDFHRKSYLDGRQTLIPEQQWGPAS